MQIRVASVVAVCLLSGCGGSSTDQTATFKKGFSSAASQFKSASQAIGTTIEHAPSQTDAQLATEFQSFAQRWQAALTHLKQLKPPSSVSAAFTQMTGAATRAEADLKAIVLAAGNHDASAAKQASTALVTDVVGAKSAATTITDKLGIK